MSTKSISKCTRHIRNTTCDLVGLFITQKVIFVEKVYLDENNCQDSDWGEPGAE